MRRFNIYHLICGITTNGKMIKRNKSNYIYLLITNDINLAYILDKLDPLILLDPRN